MNETKTPSSNETFLRRLNDNNTNTDLKLELAKNSLKNVISKEVKWKDLNDRLQSARQEKVIVREVLLESELDFVNSLKQLKSVFKEELKQAIEKLNDLYNNEYLKLQQLYRSEIIGNKLLELVRIVNKSGWYLLMKDTSVNLCKFYNPAYEVSVGISEQKNYVLDYEEPVCYLKAIYINLLHTKITYSTINLSTENSHHPNCEKKDFGGACSGAFEDVEIPIENPEQLLLLLDQISNTYERIHLDSSYYTPVMPSTLRKESTIWKTA